MWALLGVVLRRALGVGWGDTFLHELRSWTLISLPWSFFMYFALLGTFAAFAYYVEARDRELQATQLTVQLSNARLRALGGQLQPHFLFNTLNAITVLLRDRRAEQALSMLDRLSDMLHQVLRTDRPHEIALQEELELVRRYLEIERVRFSDRLQVKYDIDDAVLRAVVPAFVLQPLVENAIRYGVASQLSDAMVEIGARHTGEALELWVRDNGQGISPDYTPGIGIENTRERLVTLYGAKASLTVEPHPEGGTIARIRLPWRSA
jgi:LytS/YehU family sensor histidine kinase